MRRYQRNATPLMQPMIMSVDGLVVFTIYHNHQTKAPTQNLGFSREERIKAMTMHKETCGERLVQTLRKWWKKFAWGSWSGIR